MPINYLGKTALITGASSGIGEQFAKALAARGADLVLVARRLDRLEALSADIQKTNKVSVTVIGMDLSKSDSASELVKTLKSQKVVVDVLVNNAGFGTNARLQNLDITRIRSEIGLNVTTLVDLTASLLPNMLEQDSGIIINIASTAAYQAVPGFSVYAATKAFVLSFTEAVWGETRNTNVKVIAVSPGATATEFFDVAGSKPSTEGVSPKVVVDTALKQLDRKKSPPSVVVGGLNRTMSSISKMMPRKTVIKTAATLFLKDK